jgi:ABC-type nitrate/sulfonate/bicarbonate transport system permease component
LHGLSERLIFRIAGDDPPSFRSRYASSLRFVARILAERFPITVNTYSGIRDVRGSMLEIGRGYGATEWQIFWKIVLPAGVPFIMAGIRLAVGLAIIGIIVAEFFTAISGLGGMIVEYANVFATAKLFVPIIVMAIGGVVLTELMMWMERRMSRWRQLERERF